MTHKLTPLFVTALLLGACLIMLISSTGCGSAYTENKSDRAWGESRGGFQNILGGSRREDR